MDIILYTTHCPRCKVLETKLKQKNINYTECSDVDEMLSMGIKMAPLLKINDNLLEFGEAVKWINQFEVEKCI